MLSSLKLQNRNDLYNYIKQDISENIYDMSDGELAITKSYCRFVEVFQGIHITLPKDKSRLNIIIHSARQNFEKCLRYVLIPDNASADLTLRTLTENLIILKFLLANEISHIRKWDLWTYNMFPERLLDAETKKYYCDFKSEVRKEYDCVAGNKPEFEQLLENKYGWAFPALKSGISLKRLAIFCNAEDIFDIFGKLSFNVHANTSAQNFTSRMEEDTYKIISVAIDVMSEYIVVLADYMDHRKEVGRKFVVMYEKLRAELRKFFTEKAANYQKLLKCSK